MHVASRERRTSPNAVVMVVHGNVLSSENVFDVSWNLREHATWLSSRCEVKRNGVIVSVHLARLRVQDVLVPTRTDEQPLETHTGSPQRGEVTCIIGLDSLVEDVLSRLGVRWASTWTRVRKIVWRLHTHSTWEEKSVQRVKQFVQLSISGIVVDRNYASASSLNVLHVWCRDVSALSTAVALLTGGWLRENSWRMVKYSGTKSRINLPMIGQLLVAAAPTMDKIPTKTRSKLNMAFLIGLVDWNLINLFVNIEIKQYYVKLNYFKFKWIIIMLFC